MLDACQNFKGRNVPVLSLRVNFCLRSLRWLARNLLNITFGLQLDVVDAGSLGGNKMSRRPVSLARQMVERSRNSLATSMHSRTRKFPLLSVGLLLLGAILLIVYAYSVSGVSVCAVDVLRSLPILNKVYVNSMHKILHVGPDTCSVVSIFLKEGDTEAWGLESYNLDDTTSAHCKRLVRKGIVRVADIKYPLPYRAQSFSLVIISDVVGYLSPRYLNKILLELTRVAAHSVVFFAAKDDAQEIQQRKQGLTMFIHGSGYPGQHRANLAEMSKFGRPAKLRSSTWWVRFFIQYKFEENDYAMKIFEQTSNKRALKPYCQLFHLCPRHAS